MGYTYDDFLTAATTAGKLAKFSKADLDLAKRNPEAGMSLLSYKKDFDTATTPEGRALAHAGAEAVRKKSGQYTGGETGGSFYGYNPSPADYNSDTENRVKELMASLQNPSVYDAQKDQTYQALSKLYKQEGERAAKDTIAQLSARTGGLASSYAGSAAAQAQNYYAEQMAGKAQELEQQDYDRRVQALSILLGENDREYDRNQDEVAWNAQQEANRLTAEQMTYERQTAKEATDYERKVNTALLAAQYGDYSGLRELGINPKLETVTQSSGNSISAKSAGAGSVAVDYDTFYLEAAKQGDNAKNWIANNYKKYGFTSATGLYDGYEAWKENSAIAWKTGGQKVTGMSGLSEEARRVWRTLSEYDNNYGMSGSYLANTIKQNASNLTREEADYLLSLYGLGGNV